MIGFRDYEKYQEFEWAAQNKFPTFLDYLIEQFFYFYRDTNKMPYTDIVRKAGELFVVEMLSSKNINFNHNINILSALKYEKSDNSGNLLICNDIKIVLSLLEVKLDSAISLLEYKKIRKLFEIAREDVFLVSTPRKVYGFISKSSLSKVHDFECFQIKIHGAINWELLKFDTKKLKGNSLVQCKDSNFQYPKPKFDEEEFIHIVKDKFAKADTTNLVKVIDEAVTQSHGTTVVITDCAEEEAKRLSASSFLISPVYSFGIIKYLTSIDGAILVDPSACCHAIGVILDGCSSETEDISQGARHNSARRYKSINQESIVIVISEDGHVTCLY